MNMRTSHLLTVFFGITTIILALYIYHLQKKERILTYYIHPVRTIIAKAGVASSLHVFHDNDEKEITEDITSAQIVIGNRGNVPIRAEDILSQIKVVMVPSSPILEAQVTRLSREVTEFKIADSQLTNGIVPVSWRILEEGDNAVIQIIYLGDEDVDIEVDGVVIGERDIEPFSLQGNLRSSRIGSIVVFVVSLLGTIAILTVTRGHWEKFILWFAGLYLLLALGSIVFWFLSPPPPFGFLD